MLRPGKIQFLYNSRSQVLYVVLQVSGSKNKSEVTMYNSKDCLTFYRGPPPRGRHVEREREEVKEGEISKAGT